MMLLRWMLLVLVTEFTTACDDYTRYGGRLDLGINAGGCYKCTGEDGTAAAGAELLSLCKQLCLSEPNCVTFEISQRPLDAYYEMVNPTGLAINCCLEYNAVSAFRNPVSISTATGLCLAEAKCWDSIELGSTCNRGGTAPAQCTYAIPADGSWAVHTTNAQIQDVRDYTTNGCPAYPAAERLLNAASAACSQSPGADDGSSTTTIIIIIVAVVVVLLLLLAVLGCFVLRKKPAEPLPSSPVASAESGVQMAQFGGVPMAQPVATAQPVASSSNLAFAPKFDVNTGQPIPKFDPDTGKQNWV